MAPAAKPDARELSPYFVQLLTYAKHVIETRPGEVVPPLTLSSSAWRKEHWDRVIRDGRARGVPRLPNAASIDDWFPVFRAFKRSYGLRNVPHADFPVARRIAHDDDGFDRALRTYLRALAESDEEEEPFSDDEEADAQDAEQVGNESLSSIEEDTAASLPSSATSRTTRSQASAAAAAAARRTAVKLDKDGRPINMSVSVEVEVDKINRSMTGMRVRSQGGEEPPKQHELAHPVQVPSTPFQQQQQQSSFFHHQQQQMMMPPPPRMPPAQGNAFYQDPSMHAHQGQRMAQQHHSGGGMIGPQADVDLIRLLATGGQAAVFLARLPLDNNSLIVLKVFYNKPSNFEIEGMRAVSLTNYAIRLIGEARVSRAMLEPFDHALREHEVSLDAFHYDAQGMVSGWCYERLQGDLEHALLDKKKKPIGNAMKMLIGLQIAYFLRGVHKAGYIFRDLKPSNILLNTQVHDVGPEQVIKFFMEHYPVIKVTDFGLVTSEKESKKTRSAGTLGYMPASQITSSNYDQTVDVTAYAITLSEILVSDLMYDISERDSDIEEEFKTLRVVDRVSSRFARWRMYLPSALTSLILDALAGKVTSIERFIEFLEGALKQVAFALDVPKADMSLLRAGVGTPARGGGGVGNPQKQQQPLAWHQQARVGGMAGAIPPRQAVDYSHQQQHYQQQRW